MDGKSKDVKQDKLKRMKELFPEIFRIRTLTG